MRPFGGTQNIYQYSSEGTQNAKSMWVNYYLPVGKRIGLFGNYNLQFRQTDTGGAGSFVSNSYNIHADYGAPLTLSRHRMFMGGWWGIGRGFNTGVYLSAHSSSRFNITTGSDNNGDSIYNDRPSFATDLTRASVVHTAFGTFDTAPIAGQQIIPINYGRAPGLVSLQAQFGKTIGLGPRPAPKPGTKIDPHQEKPERPYQLTFSVQSQNVLNHVNPGTPVGQLSSPYFGRSLTVNAEQGGNTAANRQVSFYTFFRF